MKKNNIKAVAYVILGMVIQVGAVLGMLEMYYSSKFLPVYVGTTYVIGNQIVRYVLYAILLGVLVFSLWLTQYGAEFIFKKFRKVKRH